ncbi:hypothetical protein HH310_28005 [Actinoplanes sp. TBRC 11911]|uniref:hypothetical protein n=1 Tax=Actinoplanes sp. TBRC 11911 TaxID=2729386 RepID=UPI00145D7C47|nr:hypothetical protein [Actinoplanes sp. TBRC 11911]NMO55016.1 hypothetical protein [Actinoplanes sp. TBRC 11911]
MGVLMLLTATAAPRPWLSWLLGLAAAGGFAARLLTVSASNAHVRSAGIDVPRVSVATLWIVAAGCGTIGLLFLVGGLGDASLVLLGAGVVLLGVAAMAFATLVRRRRTRVRT